VSLHYGKPNETRLSALTVAEAKRYLAEKHFAAGSMGPKIQAAIDFIEGGGREVIITSPEHIGDALDGKSGTRVAA
jgi:carbamate kinase